MIIKFTVFSLSNGEVLRWGSCVQSDVHLQKMAGEGVMEGEFKHSDYYHNGTEFVERPAMSLVPSNLTLAVDEVLRIDGIPPDTLLKFPGDSIVVHDGYVEWASAVPGEYQFKFINFPYKDEVIYASVS